jgi:signal recognition particle GTPase
MNANQNIEEKISTLHQKAKTLLLNKTNEEQIISELTKEDVDASYAKTIIENVKDELSDKNNFWKELFIGIFLTVAGLLLNYFSFVITENIGGTLVLVFWGIVAFGITIIFRAFILFKR